MELVAKVKVKVEGQVNVLIKGDNRIIVQSSNDFSKATEQLLYRSDSYFAGRNFLKNIRSY